MEKFKLTILIILMMITTAFAIQRTFAINDEYVFEQNQITLTTENTSLGLIPSHLIAGVNETYSYVYTFSQINSQPTNISIIITSSNNQQLVDLVLDSTITNYVENDLLYTIITLSISDEITQEQFIELQSTNISVQFEYIQ